MLTPARIEKMPIVSVLMNDGAISVARLSDIAMLPVFYSNDGKQRKGVKKFLRDGGATYRKTILAALRGQKIENVATLFN